MESLLAAQHGHHAPDERAHWRGPQDVARRRQETELNLSEEFSTWKCGNEQA